MTLILPRSWIKFFSGLVAFLAGAAGVYVLIAFTAAGKTPETVDLLFISKWLVFGVVIDKLSVLIGAALGVVGFLIVVYSTGYLTMQNREHPEKDVEAPVLLFPAALHRFDGGSGLYLHDARTADLLRGDRRLLRGV